jgi:hypothetical protein
MTVPKPSFKLLNRTKVTTLFNYKPYTRWDQAGIYKFRLFPKKRRREIKLRYFWNGGLLFWIFTRPDWTPSIANQKKIIQQQNQNAMKKIGIFFLLILLSTIIAGIYGALHDQVTYSISAEYFTVFKFDQFGFTDWGNATPRFTTAVIGFLATWWVGLIIGIFQSLVGLIHKSPSRMFKIGFRAVVITLGTAVAFAVIGGIVGYFETLNGTIDCCFPYEIIDKRNFRIVGTIHNFGYAGGEIGAVLGFAYQIWKRKTAAIALA